MKKQIETLEEAIEAGLDISAVYAPNGEVIKIINFDTTKPEVEFQDGTIENVDRNDLIDYNW